MYHKYYNTDELYIYIYIYISFESKPHVVHALNIIYNYSFKE